MSLDDLRCSACQRVFKRERDLTLHEASCENTTAETSSVQSLASSIKRSAADAELEALLGPAKRPLLASRGSSRGPKPCLIQSARRAPTPRDMSSVDDAIPRLNAAPEMALDGFGDFNLDDLGPLPEPQPQALPLSDMIEQITRLAAASATSAGAAGSVVLPSRARRLPARYVQNTLPEGPASLQDPSPEPEEPVPPAFVPRVVGSFLQVAETVRVRLHAVRTRLNRFGLSRYYFARPEHLPESHLTANDLVQPEDAPRQLPAAPPTTETPSYDPYPNKSSWLLGRWQHGSSEKSQADFKKLTAILESDDFDKSEIRGVKWDVIDNDLAVAGEFGDNFGRGWKRSTVQIQVPTGQKGTARNPLPRRAPGAAADAAGLPFPVPGILHRSIVSVIKTVFGSDPVSAFFHHIPFVQSWKPPMPGWASESIFGELYSSKAFQMAHDLLQASAPEPGCSLPRVVCALMLGSDETLLTQFGNATLWPLYLWFGNQSKYDRAMPSKNALHPIAFLQSVPDVLADFLRANHASHGKSRNGPLHTHCKRELFHAILHLIFDDEFWHAYQHGIVITGPDGVTRRHYPRLFTYSADYPEKVLLATIRDKGKCPCTRCFVREQDIFKMGRPEDMTQRTEGKRKDTDERQRRVEEARHIIYELGYAVGSDQVDALLMDKSWVPTMNIFSALEDVEVDVFELLVLDLMHEFELGVWKALFIHLIRMVRSVGEQYVTELDRRYREMSPFGRDTIRRFPTSVSALSKLTAHDFEDLLLCAIPCFEGLFPDPECDTAIRRLLYAMLQWHGLAKARMHSDSTIVLLHNATRRLGRAMRHFSVKVCPLFKTTETADEFAKRQAKAVKKAAKEGTAVPVLVHRSKTYNLNTPKFHFMGDYPYEIVRIGTTDSWTSQTTELGHCQRKTDFESTSKRDFESQLVKISNRRERLREMDYANGLRVAEDPGMHDETAALGDLKDHHTIAKDESNRIVYGSWIAEHCDANDQAFEDFLPQMLAHFYERLRRLAPSASGLSSDAEELDKIHVEKYSIYQHARASFNYTTYDVRRAQDFINSNTDKRDIMLLADTVDPAAHPFLYARVFGVFHAHISHPILSPKPRKVEFLWVRWLQCVSHEEPAWQDTQLPRVRFVHVTETPMGFVDPDKVLRASFLMPRYALGRTSEYIGPSVVKEKEGDYEEYYVNTFADRDMMFRYIGLGVGHAGNMPASFLARTSRPTRDPDAPYQEDDDIVNGSDVEDNGSDEPSDDEAGAGDSDRE